MPKIGAQPGNTNSQKGEAKRLPWYGIIDPATKGLIIHWAKVKDRSQSEIVDEAIGLFNEVEIALQVAEDDGIIDSQPRKVGTIAKQETK